jgi:hypothetical protein
VLSPGSRGLGTAERCADEHGKHAGQERCGAEISSTERKPEMPSTKTTNRTEVHAVWCDGDHDPKDAACDTENKELVVEIAPHLSVWPAFDPDTEETLIQLDTSPGRAVTLDEAAQLAAALLEVRANLLKMQDRDPLRGLPGGDGLSTSGVVEAFRIGYMAGLGAGVPAPQQRVGVCDECGATDEPVRQREVIDGEGHGRLVWECLDGVACWRRLRGEE